MLHYAYLRERRKCLKERFTKFMDTIIELDKGDHSLTDKQWMKKQKWIFALKLFWVIVLVATFLLAINVSVSYFVYFFYFVGVLFILTKVLEVFINRRVAQLAEEE
jgi:succinate dehydrogenase, cytochrome B subunit